MLAGAFGVLVAYQLFYRGHLIFFVSYEVPSAAMPPQALQLEPRRASIE